MWKLQHVFLKPRADWRNKKLAPAVRLKLDVTHLFVPLTVTFNKEASVPGALAAHLLSDRKHTKQRSFS